MKYLFIEVEGNCFIKEDPELTDMQNFVKGFIEKDGGFYCNEDGLHLKLPFNRIYPKYFGNVIKELI